MCLYYPGLGYYMKESTNIGRTGDFYTSPHLHQIFGAMIGRQIEEMWHCLGEPDSFHIVEMGAGMGYLARDILEYLKGKEQRAKSRGSESNGRNKTVFHCLTYIMSEINPSVKQRQRALLKEFADRTRWVSAIGEIEPVTGCFLSNELLDAFPVRMFGMCDEPMEIYVSLTDDNRLIEIMKPCSEELKEYLKSFGIELARGHRSEANIGLRTWIRQVSGKLREGFILTIDYGYPAQEYYSEDRNRGTLLCYYRHLINEDPYQNIGEQDLTAHVNFSSLKRWGEESGLKTLGFCPQGTYLVSLGIDEVIFELYGESPDAFETARIKGLILPQGMGESHKVMIQYKGNDRPKLAGFALRNQVWKL